jgi:hypothetical protein
VLDGLHLQPVFGVDASAFFSCVGSNMKRKRREKRKKREKGGRKEIREKRRGSKVKKAKLGWPISVSLPAHVKATSKEDLRGKYAQSNGSRCYDYKYSIKIGCCFDHFETDNAMHKGSHLATKQHSLDLDP